MKTKQKFHHTFLFKIQGLSLKWKLLIPFLGFALVGTITLVYVGLSSQMALIEGHERKEILNVYKIFLAEIQNKEELALSIAATLAEETLIQELLAKRARAKLLTAIAPVYERLNKSCGLWILNFHIPPGRSFLRVHAPQKWGEMIAYRRSVSDVMKSGRGRRALEWDLSGVALRGVSPVYFQSKLVGALEVGFPFGKEFLMRLKRAWGADFIVYEKKGEQSFKRLEGTVASDFEAICSRLTSVVQNGTISIFISPPGAPKSSILLGPVKDYHGEVIAVVEIHIDRSEILARISYTRRVMFLVGAMGIGISFLLTWLVASIFVRPIEQIVEQAGMIAEGKRETVLEARPMDEMGKLTQSLNQMLNSLKERQEKIEEYARTLESRVRERTADLVASEEKYRALVEHLPLVVYRILKDGTTEFVNSYFTEKLGYSAEEVVGNKRFWREVICGEQEGGDRNILDVCWEGLSEFRTERMVKDKTGRELVFMDRAIPMWDDQGGLRWIDGIMVDITEQKRLQERALRAEEIRIVGEISARFAHELRNPLTIAGGFARRLRDSFPPNDPKRKNADIIVHQILRLEQILKVMLSSVKSAPLCLGDVDFECIIRYCLNDLNEIIETKAIKIELSIAGERPCVLGDEDLLAKAFGVLLEHAVAVIPEGEVLSITIHHNEEESLITFRHKSKGLTQDDLDQFFLPRALGTVSSPFLDLPVANVIIHRHGGRIKVKLENRDILVVNIYLPVVPLAS